MKTRLLALLFCLVWVAFPDELSGPALGLVNDPAHGLMTIRGTAGASTFGEPQPLGSARLLAATSSYAILAAEDGAIRVGELLIPVPVADLVSVSPEGTAAAFYDRGGARIRVITGLPREANLAREVDVTSDIKVLAVTDDGAVVAASSDDAVMLFGPEWTRVLTAPHRASAMTFRSGSRELLVADRDVYLIRDGESVLLTTVEAPAAVAASRDGKRAFLASSAGVRVIEIETGAVTDIGCACEPKELAPLAGNAVFRLTDPASGPVWLLDADREEPAAVFVPRYQTPEEAAVTE